jgi:hypothetical protein
MAGILGCILFHSSFEQELEGMMYSKPDPLLKT